MKKYLDWIVAHKTKTGLIVFGLFIIPLIVIHLLYKWITPHYMLQSSWSSGELITYIAGFEAFVGTIVLGIIAVRQNEKVIEMNERMIKREEKRDAFERQPILEISNCTVDLLDGPDVFRTLYSNSNPIYFNIDNIAEVDLKKPTPFLKFSFSLSYSAKAPMKFTLNEVRFSDNHKKLLSKYRNLVLFSSKTILDHPLPNIFTRYDFILPMDSLKKQTQSNVVINISLTSNISEQFDFSIFLFLYSIEDGKYVLIYEDTKKID